MSRATTSAFDLPTRLAGKADPSLIAEDDRHLAVLQQSLEATLADVSDRLDAARRRSGGNAQEVVERDHEVRRLAARQRLLRRFGLDLCLGRMVPADGGEPVYVGRMGLTGPDRTRLLVDWRSPAAEPFFGATHADPRGLLSRRRYRWSGGRICDYWDEVFDPEAVEGHAALDDQSAFIASLGAARSARMRDVLTTIAADQDAIVRAGARGVLVVDGGPGTGKTVVALHRAAYLLHADPRLDRGGVLVIGPSRPFLAYVDDVLPSLGEDGVRTSTLLDLVPEGAEAVPEPDPEVAGLKADARMVTAIEPAVGLFEEPPTEGLEVTTPWVDLWVSARDWAEAFESPDPGTPHNQARDEVWEALLSLVAEKVDDDVPVDQVRRWLSRDGGLRAAFDAAWPLIEPTDVIEDLWTVPAYLRRCAPWLTADEAARLRRHDGRAWTTADLPLLDAARLRVGDPGLARRRRRESAAAEGERAQMDSVIDHLVAADDSEMAVMQMLKVSDLREALVPSPTTGPDGEDGGLDGPFAHIVVDEAQELTDAEWQMVLRRCPSRSLTVVGDRAQARNGFPEAWTERLSRVGVDRVTVAALRLNYRTPEEVMAEAEPAIRAALPGANVPTSVRRSGIPVHHGSVDELTPLLAAWLAEHDDGTACVISRSPLRLPASSRVRRLAPEASKGLEFDLVVVVEPGDFGDGVRGAVDRYVALTRATQRLVVLTGSTRRRDPGPLRAG